MNTEPNTSKRTRGQRVWTDAQRAEQARKIRDHHIWCQSTGPKTSAGKATSACNSYKHGRFTYEKKILRWYTRLAVMRLKQLKCRLAYANYKRENELINQNGDSPRSKPDIMAYYPYFKVHPLDPNYPKRKSPKKPPKKKDPFDIHDVFDYLTTLSEIKAVPKSEN